MHLKLIRKHGTVDFTAGELYLVGVPAVPDKIADTIEDQERTSKVAGKTAIPVGTYSLRMTMSNRFKKVMPELLEVPNFVGVRIHSGNTVDDTEGCILCGSIRDRVDFLYDSRVITAKVYDYINQYAITLIEIV
jgi:hypothetical protein